MATVGTEINKKFNIAINAPISVYGGGQARRNSLFKDALTAAVNKVYKALDGTDYNSKIRTMISTNNTFTLTNNEIVILTDIVDYYEVLGIKLTIQDQLSNYSINKVKVNPQTGTITVTFNNLTPLRGYAGKAEQLLLTNFMGYNDTLVYVKQITDYSYELYLDVFCKNPLTSVVPYNTSASVIRVVYKEAKPYVSSSKGNYYGQPSINYPKYEIANGNIKVYPTDYTIPSMVMDYITIPPYFIDVADDTQDVEEFYPYNFIIMIIDEAKRLYEENTGDYNEARAASNNVNID